MSTGLLAALLIAVLALPVLVVLLIWTGRGRGRHSDKNVF